MRHLESHLPVLFVATLLVAALSVWSVVLAREQSGMLTVAFLDVGQGDAIFIEAPNGNQVLIDGGKGQAVLEALGDVLPFGDHTINTVIATHPDLDHIGGLPEVFVRYEIGMFLEPGVLDDGADNTALHVAVNEEGLEPIRARAGTVLALDEGVYLEVLFPDRDAERLDANMGSIVARLTYGDSSFLFTGDSPAAIETYLTGIHGTNLHSDVIKLGHHGSKTSSSEAFLTTLSPKYAIVSAGCDNGYGHPHADVVERVRALGVAMYQTCTHGTIRFESDGTTLVVR